MENRNRAHAMEILAPGGSYESIISAMNSGADAIYTGGGMFGARDRKSTRLTPVT